jgi:hypothetical protein
LVVVIHDLTVAELSLFAGVAAETVEATLRDFADRGWIRFVAAVWSWWMGTAWEVFPRSGDLRRPVVTDRFALIDLSARILAAPMAGGPSTPALALAAAVSSAGGLGFLAGGMVSAENVADEIVAMRRLTSGPIGLNLCLPQPRSGIPADSMSFAEALSPVAESYGVPLGEPHRDDDDFA